jgi:hypothetical protein
VTIGSGGGDTSDLCSHHRGDASQQQQQEDHQQQRQRIDDGLANIVPQQEQPNREEDATSAAGGLADTTMTSSSSKASSSPAAQPAEQLVLQKEDEPNGVVKDSSEKQQHEQDDNEDDDDDDEIESTSHHDGPASFSATLVEDAGLSGGHNKSSQVAEGAGHGHGHGTSSTTGATGTTSSSSNNNNINNTTSAGAPPPPFSSTSTSIADNSGIGIAHPSNSIFPHMAGPPPPSFDMMRRGSMNSAAGFMDDSFFRRPSLGFDMNAMDNFFSNNRRDSMDSSTAVLDAAIMDLSRRRFSTLGAMNMIPEPVPPPSFASGNSVTSQHESISQRQQQLKQQQRELEQRQRDLEYQRQQLIASMQNHNYNISSIPTNAASVSSAYPSYNHHAPHHQQHHHHHRGSLGMGGGSLGLGSVHSQGSSTTAALQQSSSSSPYPHRNSAASGSSSTNNQSWFVCQICNSKAFVSAEEVMQHESICTGAMMMMDSPGNSNHRVKVMDHNNMKPMPMHNDPHGMNNMMRPSSNPFHATGNPSLSMDQHHGGGSHQHHLHQHRNLSLGLGTMDNSTRGVVSMGMDSSRGGSMGGFDGSRHMSLGMDSSNGQSSAYLMETPMSMGPFAMLNEPVPLAMPSDKDWLTPLHCFVRQHCVEVFTASESDVATPSKGKRKPIQVGQIGIRCPHCHAVDSEGNSKARERGSVYYPTSISSIYNATMNLLQRHLHSCPAVPSEIMARYETLKADDARSGTSKKYWVESARSLGLVDTPSGIRHSALRPPPLPTLTRQQESTNQTRRNSTEFFSSKSNADMTTSDHNSSSHNVEGNDESSIKEEDGDSESEMNPQLLESMSQSSALVADEDLGYATGFSYHLLSQMQQCVFTEADRLGKRKGLPPGFPGLACRHCFGGYGSGRFFPSSIKTLSDTSKTLNVLYNHMMRCRKCPKDIKKKLEGLRGSHDDERAKMKFGSQKAFFARIWERLHGKDAPGTLKRGIDPRSRMIHHHQQHQQQQQQQQHHQQQQQLQQSGGYAGHLGYNQQHPMMGYNMRAPPMLPSGLDPHASSVSSPSKRRKLEHSV